MKKAIGNFFKAMGTMLLCMTLFSGCSAKMAAKTCFAADAGKVQEQVYPLCSELFFGMTEEQAKAAFPDLAQSPLPKNQAGPLVYTVSFSKEGYTINDVAVSGMTLQFAPALTVNGITYGGGLYEVALQLDGSAQAVKQAVKTLYGDEAREKDGAVTFGIAGDLKKTVHTAAAYLIAGGQGATGETDLAKELSGVKEDSSFEGYPLSAVKVTDTDITASCYALLLADAQKLCEIYG